MEQLKWWQKAVFYQIYPRSFADGNGDGKGDLAGMIERLDYLQDLGVDAIWLSPHYPSPFFDCGYDISDFTGVATEYGTMQDFEAFLDGLHRRGMRLVLDMVLNHTSHLHPWFVQSRSSRENPRRDWYIWQDGKDGGPPNNWNSYFGGSAWELDPLTGQYYYHLFFKQQPDLNWRNPEVVKAMFDAVRFWLDMGVDGFRLDAIGSIFEDPELKDHPSQLAPVDLYLLRRNAQTGEEHAIVAREDQKMFQNQLDQPGIHPLMEKLRSLCDDYEGKVLIGETEEISFYGVKQKELHLVFNFPLMRTSRLTPQWIRANQKMRLGNLPEGAWPCNTLGNHDSPRVYSRYGDGVHDDALARLSLAVLLTLRGTPFLYYGEEIGMTDLILKEPDQFMDLQSEWVYEIETERLNTAHERAVKLAAQYGRDKCRTPMQGSNAEHAGFCPSDVEPWLPVHHNYRGGVNVADQEKDPDSLLNYYRRMLRLRKDAPALIEGKYIPIHPLQNRYLAFLRELPNDRQTCLVVLNYSQDSQTIELQNEEPLQKYHTAKLLYSSQSHRQAEYSLTEITLAPFEIFIAELDAHPAS